MKTRGRVMAGGEDRCYLALPRIRADPASTASAKVKPCPTTNTQEHSGSDPLPEYAHCYCCHAKTVTAIWGILEAGVCVASYIPVYLITQHWELASHGDPTSPPHQQIVYLASMITTTIQVFIIGTMEYAIATEKWALMIPYLVQQALRFVAFSAALAYAEIRAPAPDIPGYRAARRAVGVIAVSITALAFLNAVRYLKWRAEQRNSATLFSSPHASPSPKHSHVYNV